MRFELRVPPSHRLVIVLHPNLRALRKAWSKRKPRISGKDTLAFFHSNGLHVSPRGRVRERKIAEIHMCQRRFGAGIFAHELQHFMTFWYDSKRWKSGDPYWERAAYLAGNLTKDFWTKYYKAFPEEAKP